MIDEVLTANGVPQNSIHYESAKQTIKESRYIRRIFIIGYLREKNNLSPEEVLRMHMKETFRNYDFERGLNERY